VFNPSFHLYQLQKIDLQIDTLSKRLFEIDTFRKDNSSRKALQELCQTKKSELDEIQNKLTDTEEKVRVKTVKIQQSESSLYSGTIKNPKELQDLQVEIKSLKLSVSGLEDLQLQQMVEVEEKEKEFIVAKKAIEKFEEDLLIQFATLFSEENEKKSDFDRLNQERKVVLDQIPSTNLDVYLSLRKSKKGIAVTVIEDGCCSACGNTITPSDYQIAKSPLQMATCVSCGRILYAG
jgi:uncharacterized protein